jgi:hypothetical protein
MSPLRYDLTVIRGTFLDGIGVLAGIVG